MYWFVSFPSGPAEEQKTSRWKDLVSQIHSITPSPPSRLQIPKLKVGTLDSLLSLSDDMIKINALIESTVLKLRRQYLELARLEGSTSSDGLLVDGKTSKDYMKHFSWEEAKYPANRPLRETIEKIQETVGRIEDDMKVKTFQNGKTWVTGQSCGIQSHQGCIECDYSQNGWKFGRQRSFRCVQ